MVAPLTMNLNGYIGVYSPSFHSFPVSTIGAGGQGIGIELLSMPATLGQALTWITNLTVPTADQTQATANDIPANFYTNTAEFPVSFGWQLEAYADYQFGGSANAYPLGTEVRNWSAPISTFTNLQSPQTVIFNIPVTVP